MFFVRNWLNTHRDHIREEDKSKHRPLKKYEGAANYTLVRQSHQIKINFMICDGNGAAVCTSVKAQNEWFLSFALVCAHWVFVKRSLVSCLLCCVVCVCMLFYGKIIFNLIWCIVSDLQAINKPVIPSLCPINECTTICCSSLSPSHSPRWMLSLCRQFTRLTPHYYLLRCVYSNVYIVLKLKLLNSNKEEADDWWITHSACFLNDSHVSCFLSHIWRKKR